jgi:hypothetical protein
MNTIYEIKNVLSGTGGNSEESLIHAAANILRPGSQAGRAVKERKQSKSEEEQELISWSIKENILFTYFNESRYLTRGAEQRIYLHEDPGFVIKLNDGIFYECWLDYFHSLLLHNYFFPNTAYRLTGFYLEKDVLHAIVHQPYVQITETTDLGFVREFLISNGFINHRNHDYTNEELGLILEDIHDENVLTRHGVLFFIDTVFYLGPAWRNRI